MADHTRPSPHNANLNNVKMQGFNMGRYHPPDEGDGSAPSSKRPRRSTPVQGQTVRFEMPYAVWCLGCPRETLVGQGVRFNAAKTRGGSYHSTPIWHFRMRHAECGGTIEIRTDPANTAYVVVSGARKRDTGDDAEAAGAGAGAGAIMTDAEREALRQNAFAKLERTIEDRERLVESGRRIDELQGASERHGADPHAANARLRAHFRRGRHAREREAVETERLAESVGLDPDILLPAEEGDARRAALVDFAPRGETTAALAKPLFPAAAASKKGSGTKNTGPGTREEKAASGARADFASLVMGNTRISRDPFLGGGGDRPARLPVKAKRKRIEGQPEEHKGKTETKEAERETSTKASVALVNYDSD